MALTSTSDLVLRIVVSGAHLLYSLRQKFQLWCENASLVAIWCVNASWNDGLSCSFLFTVTLTSDLVSRIGIKNSKLGVLMHLGMTECRFLGHYDLDL